jgi:tRNA (guanine10-N2)-dimethyltransferase
MQIYFFVLGTNHTLSKIDIVNVLLKQGVGFGILTASEEVLVAQTKNRLQVEFLMQELGSAAKVGEVFKSYPLDNFPDNFLNDVGTDEFNSFFIAGKVGKFGVSTYGAGGKFKDLNKIFFLVPSLEREIKARFAEQGIEAGYIKRKERELSSVTVDKENLIKEGFELFLGVGEKGVLIGKTLAIQDYESYSLRDYGRPARDPKAGMIPPKLAKMMVNLAGKDKADLFLDPFCGSGTMLQEETLLGYKNLIGTDSSEKSIRDAKTNLDWLFDKYGLRKQDYKINLFQADVAKISSFVSYKTVSAIVTEPYLGSPSAKTFHLGQIQKEVAKLGRLYLSAFSEFRKVLKDSGVIVMIFPIFRFKGQTFHLDIMDGIYALGFKKRELLENLPPGGEKLNLNLTSRGSVIFFRPGQTVSREIFVFERT